MCIGLAAVAPAAAQSRTVTLRGTVVSDSTGAALEGAHVFIAASMLGTVTDKAGQFRLEGVPVGAQRLHVTTLGYKPESRDLLIEPGAQEPFAFRLRPDVIAYQEVTIEGKEDKKWKSRLEKFTRLFIGETPNAEQVRITNPEVLDFDETLGQFVARAGNTLVIENKALGYRVHYFLKEFGASNTRTWYDGEPLFEELSPESEEQAAAWKQARMAAFMGSFRHFTLALLAGRLEEQGFMIFSRPGYTSGPEGAGGGGFSGKDHRFPMKPEDVFSDGASPDRKMLDFKGAVEIIYTGEYEDPAFAGWMRKYGSGMGIDMKKQRYQTSWIHLEKGPTLLDYKGDVLDPFGVLMMGYFAYERVADQLPKEYRPLG